MRERAGRALGPDWRVVIDEPAALVLEKSRGADLRRAGKLLVVLVGAALSAVALISVTPSGLEVATWPVAVLLALVAALGLASTARSLLLGLRGVQLAFGPAGVEGTVCSRGLWHDLRGLRVRGEPALIAAIELRHVAHAGMTLCLLEVRLSDGRTLQGPEVAVAPGSPDPLEPIARAAAVLVARPLVTPASIASSV